MLRDTDSKVRSAGIEKADTCPPCNLDSCIGIVHSTRESLAREGIDSECNDRETQLSQQSYDVEEF